MRNEKPVLAGQTDDCTDLRNAELLVEWHGAELRYVYAWRRWLGWDGKRWCVDDAGAPERAAVRVARRLLAGARANHNGALDRLEADPENDSAQRSLGSASKRIKHAVASQSSRGVQSMLKLACTDASVVVRHDDLDADPWALNVANGTIDLRTGKLRAHRREDLNTKLAPVDYDPSAKAPAWEAFVHRILGGNAELIAFVQRLVGYSLTGVIREHSLPFFFGDGANGKSTFTGAVRDVLGDYATAAPRGLLFGGSERHPTELTTLFRARFVTCSEVQRGQTFDEALVKDLTGGDAISARRMREDFWQFQPTHKLFLAGNHKPRVKGDDEGIWRRIKLVPFTVTIPAAERDAALPQKLRAELPGILAWCVRGCLEWQKRGLAEPRDVSNATAEYRDESDPLAEFFAARCALDETAKVPRAWLRTAYDDWCKENGVRYPLSSREFGERLRSRGVNDGGTMRIAQKPTPVDAWVGVRLRTDLERESVGSGVGRRDVEGCSSGSTPSARSRGGHTGSNSLPVTTPYGETPESFGDWLGSKGVA